jgi:hypothetical protein
VESAEAVREAWADSARDLRERAQQCYLLIGVTDDLRMKSHLLDLGLRLEQRVRLIEGGPPAARQEA